MTAPRLLMVANELDSFFNHRLPIARAARAAGWDVHVAMGEAAAARARDTDGLTFHHVPLKRSFAAPWMEARAGLKLRRLAKDLEPRIVHAFTLKPVLLTGLALRGLPVGFVGSITGLGSFFAGSGTADRTVQLMAALMARAALNGARTTVIVQNADDRDLIARRFGLAPGRIELIPGSGVDLDRFRPAPEPPGPLRIVLAARMIADKGVGDFVEAARLLRSRGVAADFILAGGLDLHNRSAISRPQIEDWVRQGLVRWLGPIPDMATLYRESHIACLPSRYREGVPKSLIEAAACGRAAVTTDMPGCKDIVLDGETGFVVPPRDPEALAQALDRLIGDGALRARLGAAARAHAEQGFGEKTITSRIVEVYSRLCTATPR